MENLFHDLEKNAKDSLYQKCNKKLKRKKEKVNSINIGVNTVTLRQRRRLIKWAHNVKHLDIESKMDFNWKQTDGINTISTEKAVM